MALLEVKGLRASYGPIRVLHGLDFALDEGSITAVLGANGAGKTTTLRALCGMVRTEGEMRFGGARIDGRLTEDIVAAGHRPRARRPRHLLSTLTTRESETGRLHAQGPGRGRIGPGAHLHLLRRASRKRRRRIAGTLSAGGEQQMLARLSRALMLRPKLPCLFDEPSFGLAPLLVRELFEIMRTVKPARAGGASFWSSRTPRWRSISPTVPTSSRPDGWCFPGRRRDQTQRPPCGVRISDTRRKDRGRVHPSGSLGARHRRASMPVLALALVMIYRVTHLVNFAPRRDGDVLDLTSPGA